jgi:uncharacterized SAM-binding protein YcdF (DUF218 family)
MMEKNEMIKNVLFGVWVALAILCLLYGMLIFAAGSGTGFFAVWIGIAFMFAIFAVVVKKGLWSEIPGGLRVAFIALVCVGLAVFLVIEGMICSGFQARGEEKLDYIIVLGAQVYESGPSNVLKYRLDKAAEYLEENPETACIVSGGQGYNEPFAEAVGMAAYLKKVGIAEERIILEAESTTTAENIANSMALIDEGASVGIVTNNFHVFRAVQTAKRLGMTNVYGIAAGATKLYLPNNMLREFFGEIKFLLTN